MPLLNLQCDNVDVATRIIAGFCQSTCTNVGFFDSGWTKRGGAPTKEKAPRLLSTIDQINNDVVYIATFVYSNGCMEFTDDTAVVIQTTKEK